MARLLSPTILLIALAGCFGCEPYDSYDWGDPVSIPDHPAFIANFGPTTNTITVLNLDKGVIVGRRRVLPKDTDADDFAVRNNKELFICIDWFKFDVELGEEVVVVDPSLSCEKIASVKTYPSPAGIFPISGDKAFVRHSFRSYEDTAWTLTLVDLKNYKVIKEFPIQGLVVKVIEMPAGKVYIFWKETSNSETQVIQEFNTTTNSLGEIITFPSSSFDPYTAVVVDDSSIASIGGSYKTIEIVQIPSCKVIHTINLTENDPGQMLYSNNKLYVCHNNGELMKYGNTNKVSVVDLNTKSVSKVLTVCNAPVDIAYTKATNKIVVISGVGTVISIIDPETDSVIKTIVSDEVGDVDDEWGYDRLRIPE